MAGYVINVGHHAPQKVIIGFPDRATGMPIGETFETVKQVGVYQIINRARVWCRRVMPDGKLPKNGDVETILEVNDPKYRGNLEFLKWGDAKTGAQAIEIRYIPMSSSLDYDYQRTVQKIETKVEDGNDFLYLTPGENKFDPKSQALLIQMYKVHPQNRDSISKNPEPQLKGHTYFEITDENTDRTSIKRKEASLDAGLLVRELSNNEAQLKNLFEILSGYGATAEHPAFAGVDHLSNPTDVYKALLMYSELSPDQLIANIDRYKKELLDRFEWAKSFNALDTTKDGFIGLEVNGKPNIIWKEVPGKGNKMLDWVVNNFVNDEVYIQTKHFKSLCEKLK